MTHGITQIEKVIYTAKAHTTGGRDGGSSRTSDGRLDVKLSVPGTPGTAWQAFRSVPRLSWKSFSRWRIRES